jgi:hypothetical protein
MLEWMHDTEVVGNLATDFSSKTIKDCESFILYSLESLYDLHLAIASESDEYMGTVSLKYINNEKSHAEFGITVRKKAMGKGYSSYGMQEIFKLAYEKLDLRKIYWCVSSENERASRFYHKHTYQNEVDIPYSILERYNDISNLEWYSVSLEENYHNFILEKKHILGCDIVRVNTISSQKKGDISFFEASKDIPFNVKRIYYITNVKKGIRRGFHAHKTLKQFLFCPYGKVKLVLNNGIQTDEIVLSSSSIGIIIDKPIWREMVWIQENSVLFVAASDFYEESDYIRNYDDFISYQKIEL